MRILNNKIFHSYISLFPFLLLIEIIFRLISNIAIFDLSFIRVFILINIISIIISLLTSLLPRKINVICNIIVIFIGCVYAFLQLGFNSFIGVYMSVKTSSQFGAVTSYVMDFLKSMKGIYYLVFIPFVLSIIIRTIKVIIINHKPYSFVLRKRFKFENQIMVTSFLIIAIISAFSFTYTLKDSFNKGYQAANIKELFRSGSNPSLCVKEFGILSFAFIDLNSVNYDGENIDINYYAYTHEVTDNSRDIDDTNFNTLISEETNETYNMLNNYYINQEITDKNEYTGIFENKNLIVIMMESVNDIIVNEKYYPNFYKLLSEGLYFNNNYSPRNSCSTGNNEFSAMTGLYSIYNDCTANVYQNNTYFTSIFNLFNKSGYETNSFHNYPDYYYDRNNIHPNIGSNNFYDAISLGIKYDPNYGGWSSDEDLMLKYLEKVDQMDMNKPFMSYITTVTSHQPYSASSYYGDLYLDLFENEKYSLELKRYMSKLKVLDNSLGILLDGLEQRDILDDTVIVLFGDHYPYGLSNDTLSEILTRSLLNNETEKVPLVIYNSQIESNVFDTNTSYVNLTPTLANMFNLNYDPRLYAGKDIFSDTYQNIVAFADSSWKTDIAYYDAISGNITYYTDEVYTDEEIYRINEEIYAKMNTSTLAIKNNYFNYLENSLKEISERNNET